MTDPRIDKHVVKIATDFYRDKPRMSRSKGQHLLHDDMMKSYVSSIMASATTGLGMNIQDMIKQGKVSEDRVASTTALVALLLESFAQEYNDDDR